MLVDVSEVKKLGKVELENVDFVSVEDVSSLGNTLKGGDLMKSYEDNSSTGEWSMGEYFVRVDSTGGYTITSGTQFSEKCSNCNIDTPCCVSGCEVFKWKEIEEDNPCKNCKFDGVCFGSMDTLEDYDTEFTKGEFRVNHKGRYWTLGDISKLETSIDKLVLYFKYVNMAYRYYRCESLCFKIKKTNNKVIVSFQGKLYSFPKNMSKKEIMLKVFRDVPAYLLSA